MTNTTRFDASDIRRYYERHTATFIRFGQGRGSIHRAVWGPGVSSRDQAIHDVDNRIATLVRSLVPSGDLHVVDLGCGVGASLAYLARSLPIRGTGITLSPAQARIARLRFAAQGLSERLTCVEGDYCDMPAQVASADLAYAIESFVHGPDPRRFFDECRRLIRPGGLLVVCDDVRRDGGSAEATRTIDAFELGWHVNTLISREDLIELAHAAGFDHESTVDLTPFLEIHRVRDRAIGVALTLLRWLRFNMNRFDHLVGGRALQTCLARGWVGYELIVLRRTTASLNGTRAAAQL